jgi:hypothetical protein
MSQRRDRRALKKTRGGGVIELRAAEAQTGFEHRGGCIPEGPLPSAQVGNEPKSQLAHVHGRPQKWLSIVAVMS